MVVWGIFNIFFFYNTLFKPCLFSTNYEFANYHFPSSKSGKCKKIKNKKCWMPGIVFVFQLCKLLENLLWVFNCFWPRHVIFVLIIWNFSTCVVSFSFSFVTVLCILSAVSAVILSVHFRLSLKILLREQERKNMWGKEQKKKRRRPSRKRRRRMIWSVWGRKWPMPTKRY